METKGRYTPTNRPAGAAFTAFDCVECGHPELAAPVFLLDHQTGLVSPYGTGCAAELLGLPKSATRATLDRKAEALKAAATQKAVQAERHARLAQDKAAHAEALATLVALGYINADTAARNAL